MFGSVFLLGVFLGTVADVCVSLCAATCVWGHEYWRGRMS